MTPNEDRNEYRFGNANHWVSVPIGELLWRYGPSGGPGGQHANTANTRVELVLEITDSPSLPDDEKATLEAVFGPRLRVVVDESRSQHRNRNLALERMSDRVGEALTPVRKRRKTRPSKGAQRRRLDAKKRHSDKKAGRRRPTDD